ncbi:MAG: biliverdin-producing heme oxygenase [Pseudohongiella sp.]|nr:biliverdin-producing heme oxygenase [Pseudohongiella sp.]
MSPNNDPLFALKTRTWALHEALEKRLAFPDNFVSKTDYSQVLTLFYIFQRQLAFYTKIYQIQVTDQFLLPLRNRLPLIEQDMHQLAIPLVSMERFGTLKLHSLDEFYGCLYVSEGSTLGGKTIQTAMLEIHGESALDWTQYLNPYAQQMQPMWQSFRSALLDEIASGKVTIDGVVNGAEKTFQYMLDTASQLGLPARRTF